MITTKSTTIYVTTDGTEYIDKDDAEEGEFEYQLMEAINECGICAGGYWSPEDVWRTMKKERDLFQKVFNGEI